MSDKIARKLSELQRRALTSAMTGRRTIVYHGDHGATEDIQTDMLQIVRTYTW